MEKSRDFPCVLLCVVQIFKFLIWIWRFEFSIDEISVVNLTHFQVKTLRPVGRRPISKKSGKHGEKVVWRSVEALVWLLWCAAAAGLQPLGLPCARNEASSCPEIFSRTLCFGRAASGGALAPEPAACHMGRTRVSTDFSSLFPRFPRFFWDDQFFHVLWARTSVSPCFVEIGHQFF